jgi:hypothetical protein
MRGSGFVEDPSCEVGIHSAGSAWPFLTWTAFHGSDRPSADGPVAKLTQSVASRRGPCSRTTPPPSSQSPTTGATLPYGQKSATVITALAAEPRRYDSIRSQRVHARQVGHVLSFWVTQPSRDPKQRGQHGMSVWRWYIRTRRESTSGTSAIMWRCPKRDPEQRYGDSRLGSVARSNDQITALARPVARAMKKAIFISPHHNGIGNVFLKSLGLLASNLRMTRSLLAKACWLAALANSPKIDAPRPRRPSRNRLWTAP